VGAGSGCKGFRCDSAASAESFPEWRTSADRAGVARSTRTRWRRPGIREQVDRARGGVRFVQNVRSVQVRDFGGRGCRALPVRGLRGFRTNCQICAASWEGGPRADAKCKVQSAEIRTLNAEWVWAGSVQMVRFAEALVAYRGSGRGLIGRLGGMELSNVAGGDARAGEGGWSPPDKDSMGLLWRQIGVFGGAGRNADRDFYRSSGSGPGI